jgi:hypothetical protein
MAVYHQGLNGSKYVFTNIDGGNDVHVVKEKAFREGIERNVVGDLLGKYVVKKREMVVPDGLVYVNKRAEATLHNRYVAFFRSQCLFNHYMADFFEGDI